MKAVIHKFINGNMTLNKMSFSKVILSIMTLRIMAFSISKK
jgi:hypothetical protein